MLCVGFPLNAQCVVNKVGNYSNDLCTAANCSTEVQTGVLRGTIRFANKNNNGNGATNYLLPANCGETQLAIGAVTFVLAQNVTLTIPDNYRFDPSAIDPLTGGAEVTVVTNGSGGLKIGGVLYDNTDDATDALQLAASNALPITLLTWKATPTPAGIDLDWASANETDNDFYLVEHSSNGRDFEELTRVPGQLSSTAELSYAFTHPAPGTGTHYYRLSQQDLDGTRTVFDVVVINYQEMPAAPAFPNPAQPGEVVKLDATASGPVTLHHIDGRRIADFPLSAGTARQITLPAELPTGVYLLRQGSGTSRLVVR